MKYVAMYLLTLIVVMVLNHACHRDDADQT